MTSLADKVARVKELDAKRTPDPWVQTIEDDALTIWMGSAVEERHSGCYQAAGEIVICDNFYDEGNRSDNEKKANAAFIAHAPQMAALIAQLWDGSQNVTIKTDNTQALHNALEIIQQQRTVMVQVRDQLNLCRPEHVTRPLIAAIDKALGE